MHIWVSKHAYSKTRIRTDAYLGNDLKNFLTNENSPGFKLCFSFYITFLNLLSKSLPPLPNILSLAFSLTGFLLSSPPENQSPSLSSSLNEYPPWSSSPAPEIPLSGYLLKPPNKSSASAIPITALLSFSWKLAPSLFLLQKIATPSLKKHHGSCSRLSSSQLLSD